jgi:phage tail tape-measure protein
MYKKSNGKQNPDKIRSEIPIKIRMGSKILSKFEQEILSKLEREAKSFQKSNGKQNPDKICAGIYQNSSGKQNPIDTSGDQNPIKFRVGSKILSKFKQEILPKLEREVKSYQKSNGKQNAAKSEHEFL